MHDLGSIIYAAVINECEDLERRKVYLGNGHHLAQRIAEMVKAQFAEEAVQVVKKNARTKESSFIK